MKRIAVFVSGNGTNCENLITHFHDSTIARVALVVSSRPDAYALTRAQRHGIDSVVLQKADLDNEDKVMAILERYGIDFIVLAGFLLMIPSFLVKRYDRRMVNIHPALLPKHGGKGMYGRRVHEAVKAACDNETGITIHWVSDDCDRGEIVAQYSTPLSSADTVADIESRVHDLEMKYYAKTVEHILSDNYSQY